MTPCERIRAQRMALRPDTRPSMVWEYSSCGWCWTPVPNGECGEYREMAREWLCWDCIAALEGSAYAVSQRPVSRQEDIQGASTTRFPWFDCG